MFPETSMTLLEQKVCIVCLTGKQFYAFEIKNKNGLDLFSGHYWEVSVVHIERVKWYAPHIRHLVADVLCSKL